MAPPLQIRFTPEKKDYIQASRTLASRTPPFLVLAAITLVIMLASVVVLILPRFRNSIWMNAALVSLLVGGFYAVYYYLLIPRQLSKAYQKNVHLQTERVFTFDPNSVRMVVGENTSELTWEHIEKAIEGKSLYLLIYKGDERLYPFLPKRAFADAQAEASFREILDEKSIPLK